MVSKNQHGFRQWLVTCMTGALLATSGVGAAYANDQTIICTGAECSGSSGAVFDETNMGPGHVVTRTLYIVNTTNPEACNLTLKTTNKTGSGEAELAARLFTVIKEGEHDVYGVRDGADRATDAKTMANLLTESSITLGVIPAGASRDYDWTVYFDRDADNSYQEASTKFDFGLTFDCGSPATVILSRGAGSTEVSAREGQVLGADVGEVLGAACEGKNYAWWVPLVLQLLLGGVVVRDWRRRGYTGVWVPIFIATGLAIISQVLHVWLGCNCMTSRWCQSYGWLNLVVWMLLTARGGGARCSLGKSTN